MITPRSDSGSAGQVVRHEALSPAEIEAVTTIAAAAVAADGVQPLSEHATLHLRGGGTCLAHLLTLDSQGNPTGYAQVDTTVAKGAQAQSSVELVVHPDYRGQGLGRALVVAAQECAHGSRLALWAHGDHEAARALARSLGYHEVRRLLLLRRSLRMPIPAPVWPEGFALRAFAPGTDDAAWLAVNAAAFAAHPEQGSWTQADLDARLHSSWFDAKGFLVAVNEAGQIAGFHWTKVHGQQPGHPHPPMGEVYVVGVDPAFAWLGLGTALTLAGLSYLQSQGLAEAMLYVDSDNSSALRMYTHAGFGPWSHDVMFGLG